MTLLKRIARRCVEARYSGYGFWLEKSGEIIPVRHDQHEKIARSEFIEQADHVDYDFTGYAITQGWIRGVSIESGEVILLNGKYPNKAQKNSLEDLAVANSCRIIYFPENSSREVALFDYRDKNG